ncbi:MAG: Ig-like domain-containing protein, partial [Acidobacteriota bacterium]
MRGRLQRGLGLAVCLFAICLGGDRAQAKPQIRASFFSAYPVLVGSRLDDLPSISGHCGVCHWKFTGGGERNPYGVAVEDALDSFPNTDAGRQAAILSVQFFESDGDGFTNSTEMFETVLYVNTPTFPGLTGDNYTNTSNVDVTDIVPYLTPTAAVDSTPPSVTVVSPNGAEVYAAGDTVSIDFSASDASGIASVAIDFSDDGGFTWRPLARNLSNTGSWSWFVPNRPGADAVIRVGADDGAGNPGSDTSDATFEITGRPAGYVPTTLRDLDMPGTQPLQGATLADPDTDCSSCHGGYDSDHEPWSNWRGSMMGQSMRDPLFLAALAIAEQDAPSSGDLCLRCHSPGGWQEGRSTDTSGGQITDKDRHGVQCEACHRLVDFDYVEGTSPPEDLSVLATVSPLPLQYGNGQFIEDPGGAKRGPFADVTEVGHLVIDSPLHRSANLCGTCHDVSNPVFEQVAPGVYAPGDFDSEHVDQDLRNMFPVERTFSEWQASEYASTGVYAPEFAGNKPDGIVSTCQDCHMPDVEAYGCNDPTAPLRPDMPLHDLTGGNTFIPDVLPDFFPGEVDTTQLQAAKARATSMLQRAATLELTPDSTGVMVRVTNETGHKLISGYPEGRRMWLEVTGFDGEATKVFESGAYDEATGVLSE